ncbi:MULTISPECIES: hypothetical protein [Nocardiopsis]|nr:MULTISPECIES: hypothetical protein [Nocardiopsis]PWV49341.1 hypothetical protein BDW27_109195 [Nocardiopsis sp. L17-MgMaSL7]
MSVVMLLGAGALVGLVTLTVLFMVTLLSDRPESEAHPTRDRSVL